MPTLAPSSIDWALEHVVLEGDGDLFPKPFEIDVLKSEWATLKPKLETIDIENHQWSPAVSALVPKDEVSFRRACQLEPVDSLLYAALIYEIGAKIESRRRPTSENRVFSYRFAPSVTGTLYGVGNAWRDFWTTSRVRAIPSKHVAVIDISDFYNQIYHHTLENQLDESGVDSSLKCALMSLVKGVSINVSRGIPIGPHASHILAEMSLIPLDDLLVVQGYEFCRYVDDIHIFCDSHKSAQVAIFSIVDFLDKSQKLSTNKQKSAIFTQAKFDDRAANMLVDSPINAEEEKILKIIQNHAGPYTQITLAALTPGDLKTLQDTDIAAILGAYLSAEEPNYIRLRWLLRRLSQTGIPSAVEFVVEHFESLLPAVGDAAAYLNSSKAEYAGDWSAQGSTLLALLDNDIVKASEYLQTVVLSLFSRISPMNHISKLVQGFPNYNSAGKRQILLAAKENPTCSSWLTTLKGSLGNMDPWQRRALLYASTQIPKDERKHWLNSLKGTLSPLETAIAKIAKAA